MASRNSLISEDQLRCPICLNVLSRPVSTPCGHNFCMSCLATYWNSTPLCQCPVCKERFDARPHLKVNTFISELTARFLSDDQSWSSGGDARPGGGGGGGGVPCDVCTDVRQEAARSCLQCLTSYCELHLRRHTLVPPLTSLEDRACRAHAGLVTLFCKTDMSLLCDACVRAHVHHDIVSVQQAHKDTRVLLEQIQSRAQQMIQQRLQKVGGVRESVDGRAAEAKEALRSSLQVLQVLQDLTTLGLKLQNSISELREEVEWKQKVADREAARFISSVEAEVVALRDASVKLEELRHTEDPFQFLQNFRTKSTLPQTIDLPAFVFHGHVEVERAWTSVRRSASLLRVLLRSTGTRLALCSVPTLQPPL